MKMNGEEPSSNIADRPLLPVMVRPPIPNYLSSLWGRRHFVFAEGKAKAFSDSRGMNLGKLWLFLGPLLDAVVYGTVFGVFLNTSRGVENFVAFLIVGTTFFNLLTKHLQGASGYMHSRLNVIKAFSFPRAALVLSLIARYFIDAIPSLIVMVIVLAVNPFGHTISWLWLLFPLYYIIFVIFCAGLAFFAAWITSLISDFNQIIKYVCRFWFYASGVFFDLDSYSGHSTMVSIMKLNPGYLYLEAMRDLFVYGQIPSFGLTAQLVVWAFGLLGISFVLFWSREEEYARG